MTRAMTVSLIVLLVAATADAAPAGYTVQILPFSPYGGSVGWAINELGHVAGFTGLHPFLWTPQTGMTHYSVAGFTQGQALDLNDHDQCVGWVTQSDGSYRPALWDGSTPTILSETWSGAKAINNSGQIVGSFGLWDHGVVTPISSFNPQDINDSGLIVGYSGTYNYSSSYTWLNGVSTQVNGPSSYRGLQLTRINELAQTVGQTWYDWSGPEGAAVLCDNGQAAAFPANDAYQSTALAINDHGVILGESTFQGEPNGVQPVIIENGAMTKLAPLLDWPGPPYQLLHVFDINNAGQIVGTTYINGQTRAVLMTPVPEPATLGLLALGGLAVLRRRHFW